MKFGLAVIALAMAMVACSHKPAHTDEPAPAVAAAPPAMEGTPANDDGSTSSATTTSLGAASSGRGH